MKDTAIKLKHSMLTKCLEWNENRHAAELVIENPGFMRKVMLDFSPTAKARTEPDTAIIDAKGPLDLEEDVVAIFNPMNLDFNNKRGSAMLLKMLVKTSVSEEFYLSTNKLKTEIIRYLNKLVEAENYTFEVDVENFSLDKIAKAVGLHAVGDEDDFVELLTDYMTMMAELAGTRLFVFFNLRMVLAPVELEELLKSVWNHQLDILLVEGKDFGKISSGETGEIKRIVVDNDLCEL